MKIFMFLFVFLCITSYSYGQNSPQMDKAIKTNSSAEKDFVCGVVKEMDVDKDGRSTITFVDGKSVAIGKSRPNGFAMALASMHNGFKFCCDATANKMVCKTFSLSK